MSRKAQLRVAAPPAPPGTGGWRLRIGREERTFNSWQSVDAGDVSIHLQLNGQLHHVAFQLSVILDVCCCVGTRTTLALPVLSLDWARFAVAS